MCDTILSTGSLLTVDQVVERLDAFTLEIRSELHVTSDTQINTVLLLDRADVRVVPFVTELTVLVARTVATHSRRVVFVVFHTILFT